jgi:hypothetical protein
MIRIPPSALLDNALMAKLTIRIESFWNEMREISRSVISLGVFAGAKAGALIGSVLLPDIGSIAGAAIGGIVEVIGRGYLASQVKRRHVVDELRATLPEIVGATLASRIIQEALGSALDPPLSPDSNANQ